MNESVAERNRKLTMAMAALLVFAVTFAVRLQGELPPFDDAYHLKRFEKFPLIFDTDRGLRGAFCPWPPLYDLFGAAVLRTFGSVALMPPIVFALFAAAVAGAFKPLAGITAGLTLALSPYLIGISRRWHIDHHYVEPLLLLLIVWATMKRRYLTLGIAIAASLLVQPALLIAAGIAFALLFSRQAAVSFFIPAVVILLYRLSQPGGYPDNGWFLGYPHAAMLAGAGLACALRGVTSWWLALLAGGSVAMLSPPTLPGYEWTRTIVEFEPMFRDPSRIGTDIANLTGGAVVALLRHPELRRQRRISAAEILRPRFARPQDDVRLFVLVYLLLALSSRRFLVVAIPLFAVGAALFIERTRRTIVGLAAAAVTVLPPLVYDIATPAPTSYAEVRRFAESIGRLPPGRVLAPWSFGHAIDVIGRHPVVIDNFGPAPDPELFRSAAFALEQPDKFVLTWCRLNGVRYVAGRPRTQLRSRSD